MKWFAAFSVPAVLLFFVIVCSTLTALGQAAPAPSQDNGSHSPEKSTLKNRPLQTFDLKTYTGFINKVDGQYMLTTPWTNIIYKLDDQKTAEKFVGKEVGVTGNLDTKTNVIHVKTIADAANPSSKP